jgi:hypothetical protein
MPTLRRPRTVTVSVSDTTPRGRSMIGRWLLPLPGWVRLRDFLARPNQRPLSAPYSPYSIQSEETAKSVLTGAAWSSSGYAGAGYKNSQSSGATLHELEVAAGAGVDVRAVSYTFLIVDKSGTLTLDIPFFGQFALP